MKKEKILLIGSGIMLQDQKLMAKKIHNTIEIIRSGH